MTDLTKIYQTIQDFANVNGFDIGYGIQMVSLSKGTPENGETIDLKANGSVNHYANGNECYSYWSIVDGILILE